MSIGNRNLCHQILAFYNKYLLNFVSLTLLLIIFKWLSILNNTDKYIYLGSSPIFLQNLYTQILKETINDEVMGINIDI